MICKRAHYLLTIMILSSLLSCRRAGGEFKLRVSLGGEHASDTLLITGMDNLFDRTDTLILTADGKGEFSFQPDTVTTLILLFPDGSEFPVFAEKNLSCELHRPAGQSGMEVSGGTYNTQYSSFLSGVETDTLQEDVYVHIWNWIERDPFSFISPYLIYRYLVTEEECSDQELLKLIQKMSGALQDNTLMADLKNEAAKDDYTYTIFPNITVEDTAGVKSKCLDMTNRGHFLIYVWASWHGQSRKGRAGLDSLSNIYSDKILTLFDLSIDANRERWLAAVLEDSLPHSQYLDSDGWESKFVTTTRERRIPYYLLLSSQGQIIAYTDSVPYLMEKMDQVLKDEKSFKTNSSAKNKRTAKKLKLQ